MNPAWSVAFIALGTLWIVVAMRTKKFYGVKGPPMRATGREMNPVVGRAIFCAAGAGLIAIGIVTLYMFLQ